ncbi:unnamed protein product, partial [Porites lobata]
QNIRKAIEKNVGCEEDLIKTLQDVEIKKRAARKEILLKKSAFLGQQRRRRESLPDVLGRNGENHHLILNRKKVSDDLKFSGIESVLGAHSWPPSPHVHPEQKSILKRRNSVADIVHSNNRAGWSESITRPAWLRRQSLHQVRFCSQTTPQATSSISDPSLLQSNAEFVLEDSTLSRYRKVLNRRSSSL